MACSPMSRAVPPLQTSSRGRQQVPLGSGLTGLQWRFSQSGTVWWSANVACQPQPREPLDNAASQLHTASTGSIRGLHSTQGACQGGGGERGEEEVDRVGKPVAKKQHIRSFSMPRTAQAVPLSHGHSFQGDIQRCRKHQGNWGMRGPGLLRHVPAHEKECNPNARYSALSGC